MKNIAMGSPLLFAAMLMAALPACNGNVPGNAASAGDTAAPAPGPRAGVVRETTNSGSYTYVLIDTGGDKVWVAGPQTRVKTGDKVTTPHGIAMKNFESKSLKRRFDTVYFVSMISTGGGTMSSLPAGHPAMPPGHPPMRPKGHPPVQPAGHPPTSVTTASTKPPAGKSVEGKVVETMEAARYTYVHVDSEGSKIWAAAPQFEVKVGATVRVPTGMPMRNFHSRTLGRTFKQIYFTGNIEVVEPAGTTK